MRVKIERLRVDAVIGAYADERLIEQTLWLDIAFDYDAELATERDTFEHAVDYDALTSRLSDFIKVSKFVLVETAAKRCCDFLIKSFPIQSVTVVVSKPSALERAETVKAVAQKPDQQSPL